MSHRKVSICACLYRAYTISSWLVSVISRVMKHSVIQPVNNPLYLNPRVYITLKAKLKLTSSFHFLIQNQCILLELQAFHIASTTSASSWGGCCLCGHTSSFGSLWLLDEAERNTCGRSSCHSCTFEPRYEVLAQLHHREDAEPSEELILVVCERKQNHIQLCKHALLCSSFDFLPSTITIFLQFYTCSYLG
jgi:hypothetical protein